ncbi:hypothetical protein [Granulicella tundricola]|uniref:hypothetical protein n=1 Tax=Granulicella tundricola TaxID=940615 RepID=UPI0012FBD1EE|nr:hypothetical protein [Granulicella tundricola]
MKQTTATANTEVLSFAQNDDLEQATATAATEVLRFAQNDPSSGTSGLGWGSRVFLLGLMVGCAVGAGAQAAAPDKLMTKEQTRELFDSVDSVMGFVSKDSGLAPVEHVKRRLLARAEVTRYLEKNFDEDESSKRLQRSEIVLKKFGLLSRDFSLRPFLLSLLTEQVAGFYDSRTKVVNLLNWVDPEDQKPVLAHELTHACQDQKVGLEKWSSNGLKGISKTASEDNSRVQVDELETARQAVTEGQAMVVFVDYSLKDTGRTLKDAPDVGQKIRESASDASSSPMLARAPLLLQRSLLFPYGDGLGFEQAVLVKKGKDAAFAGVLADPPSSTFQIMNPDAYMAHVPVPVLRMPDVHAVLDAEYEPYDVGVMGELDVEMLVTLFGGRELGTALAAEWDGGVYYAGQRKSASVADKASTGSVGLVYFSRWKSEEAAQTFLRVYGEQLPRKYSGLKERNADEQVDEQVFSTSEGDVVLSVSGETVFVSEGIGLAAARKLHSGFLEVQGRGPMKMAMQPTRELTYGLVKGMAGFGVMKAGLMERYTGGR